VRVASERVCFRARFVAQARAARQCARRLWGLGDSFSALFVIAQARGLWWLCGRFSARFVIAQTSFALPLRRPQRRRPQRPLLLRATTTTATTTSVRLLRLLRLRRCLRWRRRPGAGLWRRGSGRQRRLTRRRGRPAGWGGADVEGQAGAAREGATMVAGGGADVVEALNVPHHLLRT
jgi:hypothetical protein